LSLSKIVILAYGHRNIKATHKSTLEITKENLLSERGDCIIALSADKSIADLSEDFRQNLRNDNARVEILIEAKEAKDVVNAFGSSRLILTHPTDLVVRKGNYICSRTLAVQADKAARDLSRELVEELKNPKQRVKITLTAKL
jgi:hypothetical protein